MALSTVARWEQLKEGEIPNSRLLELALRAISRQATKDALFTSKARCVKKPDTGWELDKCVEGEIYPCYFITGGTGFAIWLPDGDVTDTMDVFKKFFEPITEPNKGKAK